MTERRSLSHFREDSENENTHHSGWRAIPGPLPPQADLPREVSPNESARLREAQLLRGAMTVRMVASKSALHSMESVKVDELPEDERGWYFDDFDS
jgi:hypothetical protein